MDKQPRKSILVDYDAEGITISIAGEIIPIKMWLTSESAL